MEARLTHRSWKALCKFNLVGFINTSTLYWSKKNFPG